MATLTGWTVASLRMFNSMAALEVVLFLWVLIGTQVDGELRFDFCTLECVKSLYSKYCGGALCVAGFVKIEQHDTLCSKICDKVLSGEQMLGCLTRSDPSRKDWKRVQVDFVQFIRKRCADSQQVAKPEVPSTVDSNSSTVSTPTHSQGETNMTQPKEKEDNPIEPGNEIVQSRMNITLSPLIPRPLPFFKDISGKSAASHENGEPSLSLERDCSVAPTTPDAIERDKQSNAQTDSTLEYVKGPSVSDRELHAIQANSSFEGSAPGPASESSLVGEGEIEVAISEEPTSGNGR